MKSLLPLCALVFLACPNAERGEGTGSEGIWPEVDLVAVVMLDESRALAIGMTGEVFETSDVGGAWRRAHVPAVSSLRDLAMSTSEKGWAVGEGVVLRTDDGGQHWRRQRLPGVSTEIRLSSVGVMDGVSALAVGGDGIVLRKQKEGSVWKRLASDSAESVASAGSSPQIHCILAPKHSCWLMGTGLRRSENAGQSWSEVDIEDYARVEPALFEFGQTELVPEDVDRIRGFVSANRHRIDLDWIIEPRVSAKEIELVGHRHDPTALLDLMAARIQEIQILIEEGNIAPENIFVLGEPPWGYEDFLDDDPEFLERYWRERESSNSGLMLRVREAPTLHAMEIDLAGFGLVVGRAGAMLRSDDHGEHWRALEHLTPHDLWAVGFGARRVVVVGAQGGLWTFGGSEGDADAWRSLSSGQERVNFDALHAISFSPSGKIGMIVGERGRILRSFDGGESWTPVAANGDESPQVEPGERRGNSHAELPRQAEPSTGRLKAVILFSDT